MQSELNENNKLFFNSKLTFYSLIFIAGIYGAYTLNVRGGVFCNAQTANMTLFGIGIANRDTNLIIHYLVLILAFVFGSLISEFFLGILYKKKITNWKFLLVLVELICVLIIGFLDENVSDYLIQVIICILCAMQFYTYRECEGTQMATIFSTNNLRLFLTYGARYIRKKNMEDYVIMCKFVCMLLFFILGAIFSTIATRMFSYRGIWAAIPVFILIILHNLKFISKKTLKICK